MAGIYGTNITQSIEPAQANVATLGKGIEAKAEGARLSANATGAMLKAAGFLAEQYVAYDVGKTQAEAEELTSEFYKKGVAEETLPIVQAKRDTLAAQGTSYSIVPDAEMKRQATLGTYDEEIKKSDFVYVKTPNIHGGNIVTKCLNIGKGCWSEHILTDTIDEKGYHPSHCKKIILTTDQDLIKDGVQDINDEFLEWFVKNPSCESVKVEDYGNFYNFRYLILIPQEEPPQETLEEATDIERIAMDKLKNKWNHLYTFGYPQRPFPTNYENDLNNIKIGLYEGAKWQQEQDKNKYSEEEVFEIIALFVNDAPHNTKEWFEGFKKK